MRIDEVKSSGSTEHFATGAQRDSMEGKGFFYLLPFEGLERVALTFERGARRYGHRNWERGIPVYRFMDSGLRHLIKAANGHTDEDHLAMAAWNMLCGLATEERIKAGSLPAELAYSTDPA